MEATEVESPGPPTTEVVIATEGDVESDGRTWTREYIQALDGLPVATILVDVFKHVRVRSAAEGKLQAVIPGVAIAQALPAAFLQATRDAMWSAKVPDQA